MYDYIALGPTPCDEECAQVGDDDYYVKSREECRRYKELLLKLFGEPPEGASIRSKSFSHDFGSYSEVIVSFQVNNQIAEDYAYNIESNLPAKWE
jgi:hypothetical protein